MTNTERLKYRRAMREMWAEIYDKTCSWCGAKQHLGGVFCWHPFCQTWDKDHTDCDHFEKWLSLQPIPPE